MIFQSASRRDLIHLMENRERISNEDFATLLNEIVRLNGRGWELGPDPEDSSRTILAVSALGDRTGAERIREEMNLPMTHGAWSVIVGIPPRIWDRYFRYTDTDGNQYEVEGSSWRYRLVEANDMVQISCDPTPTRYPSICEELARVLCVGELGEENIIDYVSEIKCAKLNSSEGKPFSLLRKDFVDRFPSCHYQPIFEAGQQFGGHSTR